MEATPQRSMAAKAWFTFENTTSKISLDGIEDVDDVREAIKKKMAPKFDKYAATDLIIRATLIDDENGSQATKFGAKTTLKSISERFGVVNKPFVKSIHFFVDVPPEASSARVVETAVNPINYTPLGYDNQQELIAQLTEPFRLDFNDLNQILATPLIANLPYANNIDPSILSSHKYLIPLHSLAFDTCKDISQLLGAILLHRCVFEPGNLTEDCFHVVWDTIILETLHMFAGSPFLEFQRNSVDVHQSGTTVMQSRPDFLCWMDQALVIRGEEQRNATMLPDALNELHMKFGQWSSLFYGQLPFVFAYASGGLKIQFCLIMPTGRVQRLDNHLYDASKPSDRLSIFRTTINILRCLKSFKPLIPPDRPLRLYYRYDRPKDVTITIEPSKVVKRVPSSAIPDELRTLYELVWSEKPKNVINLIHKPKYNGIVTSLQLHPVGFQTHLKNTSELKNAVRGILSGLEWLHQFDYVHRDLRWDNIIHEMDNNVRLIDLEHARKVGMVDDDEVLLHWPKLAGGMYEKEIDMYCVSRMMKQYSSLLDDGALTFMEKLTQGISADRALQDLWFTTAS